MEIHTFPSIKKLLLDNMDFSELNNYFKNYNKKDKDTKSSDNETD